MTETPFKKFFIVPGPSIASAHRTSGFPNPPGQGVPFVRREGYISTGPEPEEIKTVRPQAVCFPPTPI
jgi:hypothetical protein